MAHRKKYSLKAWKILLVSVLFIITNRPIALAALLIEDEGASEDKDKKTRARFC